MRVEDLFGDGYTGNLLQGKYQTEKVYSWFQDRHSRGTRFIDSDGCYRQNGHHWRVPIGVAHCLHTPLLWSQMASKYPFYVTWRSPRTGKRLRKEFMSLAAAIVFVAERAQYVDSHATIVNKLGIDIPPRLRGRLPKPWVWCPRCMKARKYQRVLTPAGRVQVFYDSHNHRLALMRCPICQATNRDDRFRRSNQQWHTLTSRTRKRRRK